MKPFWPWERVAMKAGWIYIIACIYWCKCRQVDQQFHFSTAGENTKQNRIKYIEWALCSDGEHHSVVRHWCEGKIVGLRQNSLPGGSGGRRIKMLFLQQQQKKGWKDEKIENMIALLWRICQKNVHLTSILHLWVTGQVFIFVPVVEGRLEARYVKIVKILVLRWCTCQCFPRLLLPYQYMLEGEIEVTASNVLAKVDELFGRCTDRKMDRHPPFWNLLMEWRGDFERSSILSMQPWWPGRI